MTETGLLRDAFERIRDAVHTTIDGLMPEQLAWRMDKGANSIGWLIWHLTRIQDDHVAAVAATDQIWTTRHFVDEFALPFDASDTGYAHSPAQVASVRSVSADLLASYHDEVHRRTVDYLRHLTATDLDRIVDSSWDPPVTLAVRLVSVVADDLQHVGQAAFVRGVLERS